MNTAAVTVEVPTAQKAKKGKKVADEEDEDEEFTTVGKGGKTIQFTTESIFKNLQAIQEARGKKVRLCYQFLRFGGMTIFPEHRSFGTNTYS